MYHLSAGTYKIVRYTGVSVRRGSAVVLVQLYPDWYIFLRQSKQNARLFLTNYKNRKSSISMQGKLYSKSECKVNLNSLYWIIISNAYLIHSLPRIYSNIEVKVWLDLYFGSFGALYFNCLISWCWFEERLTLLPFRWKVIDNVVYVLSVISYENHLSEYIWYLFRVMLTIIEAYRAYIYLKAYYTVWHIPAQF